MLLLTADELLAYIGTSAIKLLNLFFSYLVATFSSQACS